MLQSITECYRVLQCVTEYRVFLAHLHGPTFGLVFLLMKVMIHDDDGDIEDAAAEDNDDEEDIE